MTDLWITKDLPVLKAAVELCDEGDDTAATVGGIAERTGFTEAEVTKSLLRLDGEQPPFFGKMIRTFGSGVSHVFSPTGHARRAVQQWPQAEDKLEEIVKLLTALAEKEPDEEKAKGYRKVIEHVTTGGRDLAIGVISSLITGG
ncbi:hypothetical protein JIG36_37385 [Actinoplanes sp. LDG1-06]|uniref:Uncharacterized protein n=1 Tax=Paractinoplanes ovalisporus TaxID=2810368 RepID=A0ABS2AMX5_9ACTN|nr:hypothetical protein [Actinoplanes ovalisporus]MBM2621191.1 hypothetical protein [Actinoplanes ovalisporus]